MPTRKKTLTKTNTAPKAVKRAPRKSGKKTISAEDKFGLIEKEAYLLAEADGFKADPLQYWLAAEKQVDALYK